MKRFALLLLIALILFSCGSKSDRKSEDKSSRSDISTDTSDDTSSSYEESNDSENVIDEEKYPDGSYCAEVTYFNPHTGRESTYTLIVEVESNEVTQINWPNRGWLDQDHFSGAELDENGNTSFTSDRGYEYEVQITGEAGDCFTNNVPSIQRCRGITEDGERCENMTDTLNGLCWQHQDQE